jgi:hypothetical protein
VENFINMSLCEVDKTIKKIGKSRKYVFLMLTYTSTRIESPKIVKWAVQPHAIGFSFELCIVASFAKLAVANELPRKCLQRP